MANRQEELPHPATGQIALGDLLLFLRRNAVLVLVFALVASLVAAGSVVLLVPAKYGASATLLLVAPALRSQLAPGLMSVQAYQTLLESGAVVEAARRRLVDRQVLSSGARLTVGRDLASEILVSKKEESTALAPTILARAEAQTPEAAAEIANTWVEVFLEQLERDRTEATARHVGVIEGQFPETRSQLEELERQAMETNNEQLQQIDQTAKKWDRTLAGYEKNTADLIAEYRLETERLFSEMLSGLFDQYPGSDLSSGPTSSLRESLQKLTMLRAELAANTPILELRKAVSEDSLWESLSADQPLVRAKMLEGLSLTSEEVNPAYQALVLDAVEVEAGFEGLSESEARFAADSARKLHSLQVSRTAVLIKLEEDRAVGLEGMRRDKESAIAIERNRYAQKLTELNRRIARLRALDERLANSFNEAVLAQAVRDLPQVRLVAPAVASNRPTPRRIGLVAVLAGCLGALLGVAVALFREIGQHVRESSEALR